MKQNVEISYYFQGKPMWTKKQSTDDVNALIEEYVVKVYRHKDSSICFDLKYGYNFTTRTIIHGCPSKDANGFRLACCDLVVTEHMHCGFKGWSANSEAEKVNLAYLMSIEK